MSSPMPSRAEIFKYVSSNPDRSDSESEPSTPNPRVNPSLCIPRVFPNITKERVLHVITSLGLGEIDHVDMVQKVTNVGVKYQRVFIHFKECIK